MKTTKKTFVLIPIFLLSVTLFQGCNNWGDVTPADPTVPLSDALSSARKSAGTVCRIGKISELLPPGNNGSAHGSGKIIEDGSNGKFYVFQTPTDVACKQPLCVGLAVVFDNPNGSQAAAINISSPPPAPTADIMSFALSASNGSINIFWTATTEVGVNIYLLDRKLSDAITYEEGVLADYPAGIGAQHSITDSPPAKGTYRYRLRASLSDGTSKIIGEGTVTL